MKCKHSEKELEKMTLAQHAEAWWTEKENKVPKKHTKAYKKMYEKWIKYAFCDFKGD